jgi:hypothetical protein
MPQACRARRRRVNGVREILWHYRENPAPNPCDINWLAKFVAKYDRDSAKDGLGVGDLADPPRLTAREEAFLCILLETGVCRPSDEQLPPLEQVVDKAEEAS